MYNIYRTVASKICISYLFRWDGERERQVGWNKIGRMRGRGGGMEEERKQGRGGRRKGGMEVKGERGGEGAIDRETDRHT